MSKASAAAAETLTKTEAIKRAIAAGKDKAATGVPWIMDEFGIEVSPGAFASTKSQLKNRGGEGSDGGNGNGNGEAIPTKGKPGRKPGSTNKPKATTTSAAVSPEASTNGQSRGTNGGAAIEDLEAVKGLVQRLGADQVARYAKLFE